MPDVPKLNIAHSIQEKTPRVRVNRQNSLKILFAINIAYIGTVLYQPINHKSCNKYVALIILRVYVLTKKPSNTFQIPSS